MKKERNGMREQFDRDGFYVFENILDAAEVDGMNALSDRVLAKQEPEHFAGNRTTGSMVMIDWAMAAEQLELAELIANPRAIAALGQLGFHSPKFGHGRIISKPPNSPHLFWHEDGRFWDDPVSYTAQPIQAFLMYYLTDTTAENGCLRVIPGSHLKRHALHDLIAPSHTEELKTFADPDAAEFSQVDDEVDVPVKAGDLVMGYGSLLHASHANRSDQRRTVLTMWYYPAFVDLPERTQATVALVETGARAEPGTATLSGKAADLLEPLRIVYNGSAEPIEIQWVPGVDLK